MRKGDWMQTFTGKAFWPLDPRPEEIDIVDIAHALSLSCRYGGHCKRFYSVAEHSILVSELCLLFYGSYQVALWGLLHDACEAYISDIPRPLKSMLPDYQEIERNLDKVIIDKFNIKYEEVKQKVKDVDNSILYFEMKELMSTPPMSWSDCGWILPQAPPKGWGLRYYQPEQAERVFLSDFYKLTGVLR